MRIGSTAVTVIEGQVPFSTPSDARFKYNVKDNVPGLDFIKKLQPVTYYFDDNKLTEFATTGVINNNDVHFATYTGPKQLHTGFLAQDVEKVASQLGYHFDGIKTPTNEKEYYTLAYSQFIMPLVKGMQEQQIVIEQLQKDIEKLQEQMEKLIKK